MLPGMTYSRRKSVLRIAICDEKKEQAAWAPVPELWPSWRGTLRTTQVGLIAQLKLYTIDYKCKPKSTKRYVV